MSPVRSTLLVMALMFLVFHVTDVLCINICAGKFTSNTFLIHGSLSMNPMDTNNLGYFASHGNLSSVYYQGKEDGNMIDLGLSLRTLQPQAYHPSENGMFNPRFLCFFFTKTVFLVSDG